MSIAMKQDDKNVEVGRRYKGKIYSLFNDAGELLEKECTRCFTVKSASDFYNHKKGHGGKLSYCKPCKVELQSKWNKAKNEGKKYLDPKAKRKRQDISLYDSNEKKLEKLSTQSVAYKAKITHDKILPEGILYIEYDEGLYNVFMTIDGEIYLMGYQLVNPLSTVNRFLIRLYDEVEYSTCPGRVDYIMRNIYVGDALECSVLERAYETKEYDMRSDSEAFLPIKRLGELFDLERDDIKFIASRNRWDRRE